MKFLQFMSKGDDDVTVERSEAIIAKEVVGVTGNSDGGSWLYVDRSPVFKTTLRSTEPFDVILKRLEHILKGGN